MSALDHKPPYELNIGAGHTYIPGFVNIDITDRAEVTLDLSTEGLPFPDDSVRTIVSIATLEHIPDYLFALGEMHRVLEHDGTLLLMLPYVTLTELHLVNPYHLHNFSERSFDLFDPALLKGSAAEDNDIAFRRVYVEYRYMNYVGIAPKPVRDLARRHLFNVVRDFDIGLVAIKDPDRPVDAGEQRAAAMRARMGELLRARTPYSDGAATNGSGPTLPSAAPPSRDRSLKTRLGKRLQPYRERVIG
jgi:SAM-dependent methyltransferase